MWMICIKEVCVIDVIIAYIITHNDLAISQFSYPSSSCLFKKHFVNFLLSMGFFIFFLLKLAPANQIMGPPPSDLAAV